MKRTKLVPAALLLLPALFGALFAAGCGGGSSSSGPGSPPAARSYAEAVTLPTGQAGALILAVQPDNSATGTLAVAGTGTAAASLRPHAAPGPRLLAPMASGVYPVTGTLSGGTFTLSGAAFTLTGTLPAGASPVSFTLTSGAGADAVVYTGTLATAPTGASANSAIAGAYQLSSISNPTTGQTVACPGTLAFGSNNDDNCTASEVFTLNSDGSYTLTGIGATNAGTYSLVGSIMTRTGPTILNGQNGPTATYVSSMVISGNTVTLTLLGTTDVTSQSQIGEVFTLAKVGTTPAFAYAGTYASSSQVSGPSGSSSVTGTVTLSPAGVLTGVTSSSGYNYTGTASLNSSGQIVARATNSTNSDVETYTGTASGSPGAYTISGTLSNSNGGTGTFTLTEISTAS